MERPSTSSGQRSQGVRSTEFWMTAMTFAGMFLNGTSYVDVPWDIYIGFMVANGLYVGARTAEKVTALRQAQDAAIEANERGASHA